MADINTSEESLNNMNGLIKDFSKALEKVNAQLLKTSNNISGSNKDLGKIEERAIELNDKKHLGGVSEVAKSIGNSFQEILTSTTKIAGILTGGGIATFFAKVVKDSIDLDNTMTALSMRMGKGSKGIAELKSNVNSLQAELGAAYGDAVALVTTLSEKKYADNLYEAASGANLFARATGLSQTEVASLSDAMNKNAGMTAKATNSMYAGMLKVQQTMGLSKAGMEAVTSIIPKMASNMNAFGKTSADIAKVTTQTTALIASMEKVGIAAGDAAGLVEKLLDPDKIEDNIMLYSQLGISMEDALSGNIDLSNMDNQLKDMAQRIVDMGPIAGKQFAQSMGMSYAEAAKLAKMEGNEVADVSAAAETSEDKALEALKQMERATEGFGARMETALNKAEGKIRQLPTIILLIAAITLPLIAKMVVNQWKKFKDRMADKKQYSVISEGVGSSIGQGFEKGKDLATAATLSIGKNIKQAFDRTNIGEFFDGADAHMQSLIKKAKKQNFADAFMGSGIEKKVESLKARAEGLNKDMETLNGAITDVAKGNDNIVKALGDEGANLKEIISAEKANGNLSNDEAKALEAIAKQRDSIKNQIKSTENAIEKTKGKEQEVTKAIEARKKAQEELKKATQKISDLAAKGNESKEAEKTLRSQIKMNEERMKRLNKNSEAYRQLKKETDLMEAERRIKQSVVDKIKNQIKESKEVERAQKKVNDAIKEEVKLKNQSGGARSFFGKIGKGITTRVSRVAGEAFSKSTFGKAFNETRGAGGSRGKAFGSGVAAVGKKVVVGGLKGTGKLLGGIMKSLGPMAIVMKILQKILPRFQPMIDKLSDFFDNILDTLSPVFEMLMGVLGPAIQEIVTALLPPVLKTLALAVQILGLILTPIKLILKALSHLPGIGKAFEGVNDVLEAITGDEMVNGLKQAAYAIENGAGDMSKAAEKQEEAVEKKEEEIPTYKATGGSLQRVSGSESPSPQANSQSSSTITTVTEQDTTKSSLEDMENKKRLKEEKTYRNDMQEAMKTLEGLFKEMLNVMSSLKQKGSDGWNAEPSVSNVSVDD